MDKQINLCFAVPCRKIYLSITNKNNSFETHKTHQTVDVSLHKEHPIINRIIKSYLANLIKYHTQQIYCHTETRNKSLFAEFYSKHPEKHKKEREREKKTSSDYQLAAWF